MTEKSAKFKSDADRVLGAIYKLAHGTPGIFVSRDEVYALVKEEQLLQMTDEQYEAWRKQVIAESDAWRKANGS